MARKNTGNKRAFTPMQFVRWRPDDEDKAAIKGVEYTAEEVDDRIDELLHNGYKFSLSYTGEVSAYNLTLINVSGDTAFANHCITFRHTSRDVVWRMLLWFHFDFAEGDWSVVDDTSEFDW